MAWSSTAQNGLLTTLLLMLVSGSRGISAVEFAKNDGRAWPVDSEATAAAPPNIVLIFADDCE